MEEASFGGTPRPRPSAPERVKLTQRVAQQIVQDIVDQGLTAGDMLPIEAEMLELYRVSRTTLRESLRVLESNGLVVLRPGRNGGARVGKVDAVEFGRTMTLFLQIEEIRFSELLEARVVIEPLMARLAAESRHPDQLAVLRAVIESHEKLEQGDPETYYHASQEFHGVVAGLSGNGVLDLFGRSLKEIYVERVVAEQLPGVRWAAVKAEHEAVAQAILNGNGMLAEALMRDHMSRLAASFHERYAQLNDEVIGWH